jgi:hypothetical protein
MKEINNMANIYEQAKMVIAAEVSACVTERFLFDWPASKFHPLQLLLPNSFGSIGIGSQEYMGDNEFFSPSDETPRILETRGWAFQEFALAQRAILFTDKSINYVCNSTSEEGHHLEFDFNRKAFSRAFIPRTKYNPKRRIINFDKTRKERQASMSVIWASTVENYSWRIFSLWEDRLPALAGVAAKFGSIWGNTNYFAGLWGACLIIHLCWRCHTRLYSREKKVPRPHVLSSPTWSWSTFPHPVQLDVHQKWVPDAKLIECSVELVSQGAPLRGVKDGSLKLQAKTISPSLMPKPARPKNKVFLDYNGQDNIYETDDVLLVLLARGPQGNARGLVIESDKQGKWQRVGAMYITKRQVEL